LSRYLNRSMSSQALQGLETIATWLSELVDAANRSMPSETRVQLCHNCCTNPTYWRMRTHAANAKSSDTKSITIGSCSAIQNISAANRIVPIFGSRSSLCDCTCLNCCRRGCPTSCCPGPPSGSPLGDPSSGSDCYGLDRGCLIVAIRSANTDKLTRRENRME
jgi:hypothetical protein